MALLQAGPPALLRTPVYIILIGIATVIVITAGPSVLRIPHFEQIVLLIDVFGLGAYAIVGLELSLSLGLSVLAATSSAPPTPSAAACCETSSCAGPQSCSSRRTNHIVAVTGCAAYAAMTRLTALPEGLAGLLAMASSCSSARLRCALACGRRRSRGFAPLDDE